MKVLTMSLIFLATGLIIGGTMWGLLAWTLVGWVKVLFGLGGLLIATLVNFYLFWKLWPHRAFDDDDD
ncbi:hypothetical protein [Levilactobacillus tujiorum]|uniref:Major facilitator superfamily (MFS) profile domain-containing protein n=1 Tax=Levilactobacillus tujiorum TaxID=2912243 RepID=A0ABX1L1N2_9LACO|nr:hypothetical protein [Levilactobacillus tujiorum]MCH5463960.1 hypothetical protein [Levilactobacillus tujiorum]NLR11534.1 hypothetical protein [Lactobacillus sp. HBUAS51387]NLR28948.1 hypothetical protein [Levilactobacillus tujiorum]